MVTTINFSKYSGCGNDFILIDNRSHIIPNQNPDLIQRLCQRRLGIGADGIILLENSDNAHFQVKIYNADGTEAEMCGNGMRCLGKFIEEIGIEGKNFLVETKERVLSVELNGDLVSIGMGDAEGIEWDVEVSADNNQMKVHYLNTGVPHAVLFTDSVEKIPLAQIGPIIRNHPRFNPKGVNFNVAEIKDGKVWMRTYERGVEQETLACGTGATATAIAAKKKYNLSSPIEVITRSGEPLTVSFDWHGKTPQEITLSGTAHFVYKGSVAI